jgi:hypothetical protein
MLWAPSLPPVSRNQSLNRLHQSLSLTAVRAITKRGDLNDRLQEVPKGDNWPRRFFSFPANVCLHLRDILALGQYTKKDIIPNLQNDPQDHLPISRSPCMPPCRLSLLFSTNKIFPTSVAEVCLCFHSQSGPQNPEHLKFLHVSSAHQDHNY